VLPGDVVDRGNVQATRGRVGHGATGEQPRVGGGAPSWSARLC
jgi:hypothetical protein